MKKIIIILSIAMTSMISATSIAADNTIEGDRFSVSLGMFFADLDTDTQLDGTIDNGTPTDLEVDLGLDPTDNVFRIDGYYRFNDRHRLDISVFDLSRTSTKQITRDIQWGDTLFAVDTVVETDFDLVIYKVAYTYSLRQRENSYLGASIGLYAMDTKISLAEQNLGQAEVGDITVPLPVIGLRGDYEFSDRWKFRGSGEFFFIEYNDIKGSLIDLYAGIDYSVTDSMSIGLGVNSVVLDVDASASKFEGSLNWRYTGGLLFIKFDF